MTVTADAGRPAPATSSSGASATPSPTGRRPAPIPRDYERALPPGDGRRRAVRRARQRLPGDRPPDGRRPSLPSTIAGVLAGRGATRLVGPGRHPRRVARRDRTSSRVADDPPLSHADLDGLDGVITGCAVAIAETGHDRPRRAARTRAGVRSACCPTCTSAWSRADQIVGTVPEALARLDADPAADVDQRPVRDQRHRAPARRGRPRPAPPRGHRRRELARRVVAEPRPGPGALPFTALVRPTTSARRRRPRRLRRRGGARRPGFGPPSSSRRRRRSSDR